VIHADNNYLNPDFSRERLISIAYFCGVTDSRLLSIVKI
jgi:hypothetical protein